MLGWCDKCKSVAIDGFCQYHGVTKPISHINAVDVHPLSPFEKSLFNEQMNGMKFGDGLFLIYSDRNYRRKVVTLDFPLATVRLFRNELEVTPMAKGEIQGMERESFINTNHSHLSRLIEITQAFADWELNHSKHAVISFSGGKDSIVLADILAEYNLTKVFIDTRLEFPETYDFVNNGGSNGNAMDITRAKASFFSLCREKGFPKHGYRWCCKTQKFEPFAQYLRDKYGDEQVSVFSGERRWEGLYRMAQPLRKAHKHIPTQQTIQPLLDWLALDIWCYIWSRELEYNRVYDFFDRAGCWLCPFGLEYRVFLLQYTHPKLYASLVKIGGVSSRSMPRETSNKEKEPCMMELEGKMVKTCDVYGHFFVNGACFRCGEEEASTLEVPDPKAHKLCV